MAVSINEFVLQMEARGNFRSIATNPLAFFGPRMMPLMGATILPERQDARNRYREEAVRYRTVVANDGTRYSPVQRKEGVLSGFLDVEFGNHDIGSALDAQEYDTLIRLLNDVSGGPLTNTGPTMQAVATIAAWFDRTVVRPLVIKEEVQRWQAIVDASVVRSGDNGYVETINFSNPSGTRINAAGTWSNNAYDPWTDIMNMATFLRNKGFTLQRIITSQNVISILTLNANIRQRLGILTLNAGLLTGLPGIASHDDLNRMASRDGIPAFETYNTTYQTQTGQNYFLKRDVMVFLCNSQRDPAIVDLGDNAPIILPNTLGYYGLGRPAGRGGVERAYNITTETGKPPGLYGEGWETGFPVILEPESIGVIKNIA